MSAPPRISALREQNLSINDGPVDGKSLREIFRRLFTQLNPYFDGINGLSAKGVAPTNNMRCDLVEIAVSHGVAQSVALDNLRTAQSAVVLGCDKALIATHVPVTMTGKKKCQITVYFNDSSVAGAKVHLLLLEEGTQLSSATYIEPAAKVQEAWTAPTLLNSYANSGGGLIAAGFFKDSMGVVHLRGTVTGGSADSIFTLPAGYRPSATLVFSTAHNALFGQVRVLADGTVDSNVGGHTTVSLDGITFDTR